MTAPDQPDPPREVMCKLSMPNQSGLYAQIEANAPFAKRMAWGAPGEGKTVVICGAGPTLADEYATLPKADAVWACNSALPYLMDRGVRVTDAFGIDQGEAMLAPHEWGRTFPVHYYVASSVHPQLVAHLRKARRKLTFFHSYLGLPDPEDWVRPDGVPADMPYEMWLYTRLYGNSVQVGYGLNAVPRAVCLALFLGYSNILVYGADCACAIDAPKMPLMDTPEYRAWMDGLVMYADGRRASLYGYDAVMAEAVIDGTRWHTRPDMVISARHLIQLCDSYPDRVRLLGATLPNAIRGKGQEFMSRMPALTGVGQVSGFGNAAHIHPESS